MSGCLAEDVLLDLARGERSLGADPAVEGHLSDCPSCSALLATLLGGPAEAARDLAGRTLGPYRLEALVGAGAMGEVYRALDTRLGRHVALKALPARFADDPARVRRLEVEARAAAAIAHPNVVAVHDVGTGGGVPYVVSELVLGETVRSRLDRGPVPRAEALALGLQLARGLAAAHARGVVHRDLKPSNLVVTGDGTLKILDFGLARLDGAPGAEATTPGAVLGTSGYLAPEQARGEAADARSDLFSAGAILYELLSGRRAFGGATFAERLSAVLRDTPPALEDPAGPAIARCLEKDPARRFQTANDLAWTLEGLLGPAAPPRPAPGRARGPAGPVSRRTFLLSAAAAGLAGTAAGRWLLAPAPPAPADFQQLTFRQGRVASARFTRDGGSVVHSAAWDGLPLETFTARPGGGGIRSLGLPEGQVLAVSARGELALSLGHRFIRGFHQAGALALVPFEGGEPRRLGVEAQHADFTPDGGELALVRAEAGAFRLELGGRVLREAGWLSHPRVSPDGATVAVLEHEGPVDDRGEVVLVPVGGGAGRRIGGGWTSIDGLAWAPDGRSVWVSASRQGGNNAVRALDLDGRERAKVPTAGRLRLFDVDRDGRMAVAHTAGRMRMMVRPAGAAGDLDLSLSDVSIAVDLSADGAHVLFAEFGDVETAQGTYVRPTAGGPARKLGDAWPVDLADDGRGVLALSYGEGKPIVLPLEGGKARPLEAPLEDLRWLRWCAGGVLASGAAPGRRPRLWRLEPGRAPVPLTQEGVHGRAVLDAAGRRAAFVHEGRLLVVPAEASAEPSAAPGAFAGDEACGWRGAEVLVRTSSPPIAVRRVDPGTGASAPLLTIDPPALGRRGVDAVVVAAGGAYAYSYGQELSRLYLMTGG
ncbi:MAG: protein kinase [Anaeromyxobacter sp.]